MDFNFPDAKTPATFDEICTRVSHALARHPLCRSVLFEVVKVPRDRRGNNWTATLRSVEPRAVWEAAEIVSDIQDAYDLAVA